MTWVNNRKGLKQTDQARFQINAAAVAIVAFIYSIEQQCNMADKVWACNLKMAQLQPPVCRMSMEHWEH